MKLKTENKEKQMKPKAFSLKRYKFEIWLVWLSGLSASL